MMTLNTTSTIITGIKYHFKCNYFKYLDSWIWLQQMEQIQQESGHYWISADANVKCLSLLHKQTEDDYPTTNLLQ